MEERQKHLGSQLPKGNPNALHMESIFNRFSVQHLKNLLRFIKTIIQHFDLIPKEKRLSPDLSYIVYSKSVVTRSGRQTKLRDILDL